MRFLTLFSGIGAPELAFQKFGWECAGHCENNAYASSVLKHHYPGVINLHDIRNVTQAMVDDLGPIELVWTSSPCTDLSVAGDRAGMYNPDGSPTRSGLFFDGMRVAKMTGARFIVFENVYGAITTNHGSGFTAVVNEMAGGCFTRPEQGWQNTGVAVGTNGILEWTTLNAHLAGRKCTLHGDDFDRTVPQHRRRLFAVLDTAPDWYNRPPIFLEPQSLRRITEKDQEQEEEVPQIVHRPSTPIHISGQSTAGTVTSCLNTRDNRDSAEDNYAVDGTGFIYSEKPFDLQLASCLTAHGDRQTTEQNYTVDYNQDNAAMDMRNVRRLTPEEWLGLMNFPLSYYDGVTHRGKPISDTQKYKQLGNSVAVNCARWVGERIEAVRSHSPMPG